ncbi:hypothetical protein DSL72_008449 [Monilinia vaccinii-corymbosi]|uniref:Transmembrane protein n=1 Tax=Monilinia vaccinii-corymbosi TaxID=61207 RepID=A0A8A3PKR9_9HELO|nr:hypothetical protein DSL72_008449 [Monilinia vaccinii-corymbosi]
MVFNRDSKNFRSSKKPTKLPKSAASSAHPHIKMAASTPRHVSLVNNHAGSAAHGTLETPTPTPTMRKRKRKREAKSISKIPTPTGADQSRPSSIVRSADIPIATGDPASPPQNAIASPTSATTIEENMTDPVTPDRVRSSAPGLPQSSQHHTPIVTASMRSPISVSGKGLCTTALSISEPRTPPFKSVLSPVELTPTASPIEPPSSTASHVAPSPPHVPPPIQATSYTSYVSFTHTPPRIPASPLLPPPKVSPSTPLLPKPHRRPTITQQTPSAHSHSYYEYHAINRMTTRPRPAESCESYNGSDHDSFSPAAPSCRSACQSSGCIRTSMICTYLLFTCSLIWLLWMSWSTITSGDSGHRGLIGSTDGPATAVSYDADIPVVTPFVPLHAVADIVHQEDIILPAKISSIVGPTEPPNIQCLRHPHSPYNSHCPSSSPGDLPRSPLRDGFLAPLFAFMGWTVGVMVGGLATMLVIAKLTQCDGIDASWSKEGTFA